jgi:putative oxidoreductase
MVSADNLLVKLAVRGYGLLTKVGKGVGLLLLLFFRINWGWQFYKSGIGKLHNHSDIVDFFSSLHLPFPDFTAWFVGGVECCGGILLLLGLASRPVGLILATNMTVAYLSVPEERTKLLNFTHDQTPFLQADPFFFLLSALLIFSFGGGPFSLDYLIGKWLKSRFPQLMPTGDESKS